MAEPTTSCPDCGETIDYRSCQQPDSDLIAEIILAGHRIFLCPMAGTEPEPTTERNP